MKNFSLENLVSDIANGLDDLAGEGVDKESQDTPIDTWQDWVNLITPFKIMAKWHVDLWKWAWDIVPGEYSPSFVAIAPRGGGKCLAASTLIELASGERVPISAIKIGDQVACLHKTTKELTTARVARTWGPDKRHCCRVTTKFSSLIATAEHRVLTVDGWRSVSELRLNDRIVASDGKAAYSQPICALESILDPLETYDIEVDYHSNMVANHLIVHNSSQAEQVIAALGARGMRKYVLYVRSSQELANASVTNIGAIFENSSIRNYYPKAADKLVGKYGNQKAWTQRMLRCANGFSVVAFRLDTALRGTKIEDFRPDLICHEAHTQIFDEGVGKWLENNRHPSFQGVFKGKSRMEHGVEVETRNIAHYRECVTPEHKFWVRNRDTLIAGWKQAKDLAVAQDQIGIPIPKANPRIPEFIITPKTLTESAAKKIRKTLGNWQNQNDTLLQMVDNTVERTYPKMLDDDPQLWQILGFFISGGVNRRDGDRFEIGARVSRGFVKLQEFVEILERHGAEVKVGKTLTGKDRLTFYHPMFNSVISSMKKSGMPHWIEFATDAQLENFIEGATSNLIHDKAKNYRYFESSQPRTMSAFQRIYARLGRTVRFHEHTYKAGGGSSWKIVPDGENPKVFYDFENGFIWQTVAQRVDTLAKREFVPVKTQDNQYITTLGLSHNCLDDIDEKHDTPRGTRKKITTLTETILPAGSTDMAVLAIQNLIITDGIFAKLADGSADFLLDKTLSGPHPAVEGLEYMIEDGKPVITAGTALWEGQSVEICQGQMRKWGIRAFLREAQHQLDIGDGGIFDDIDFRHVDMDGVPDLDRVVCWIDPAVSTNKNAHCQAIQIDGCVRDGDDIKIYRLYSWEGVDSPSGVIRRALQRGTIYRTDKIGFETNMGGLLWKESYDKISKEMLDSDEISYIPPFASQHTSQSGDKSERASQMLDDYITGVIYHVRGYTEPLEAAMRRFPGTPDDLVDACYHAWKDVKQGAPKRKRGIRISAEMLRRGGVEGGQNNSNSGQRQASSLGRRLGFRGRF